MPNNIGNVKKTFRNCLSVELKKGKRISIRRPESIKKKNNNLFNILGEDFLFLKKLQISTTDKILKKNLIVDPEFIFPSLKSKR
jgi:hypothetical protein